MVHPRAAVAKLTKAEIAELNKGPQIKIYTDATDIGQPTQIASSALLAHYSPCFAACFNPEYGFKEALEGVLRLPEDYPLYVNAVVEYMKHGSSFIWVWESTFCDKYNFTKASCIISEPLGKAKDSAEVGIWATITSVQLSFIFGCLHKENKTLTKIARFLAKALCDKSTENLHTNKEELIGEDERIKKIMMDVLIDIPRGKLLEDVKSFPG